MQLIFYYFYHRLYTGYSDLRLSQQFLFKQYSLDNSVKYHIHILKNRINNNIFTNFDCDMKFFVVVFYIMMNNRLNDV